MVPLTFFERPFELRVRMDHKRRHDANACAHSLQSMFRLPHCIQDKLAYSPFVRFLLHAAQLCTRKVKRLSQQTIGWRRKPGQVIISSNLGLSTEIVGEGRRRMPPSESEVRYEASNTETDSKNGLLMQAVISLEASER